MKDSGTKVILSAIFGNGFITVIKFIGWFFSMSPSMLAEAVHSLADTFNQILVYIGVRQSKKEISKTLPTGSGSARYVWNLISAVGIFFIGFGFTFYHGVHSLLHPPAEPTQVGWITYSVLAIAFIIEYYILMQAYYEVKKLKGEQSFIEFFNTSDDPSIIAILLEDAVAVFGVVLAICGIVLGQIFEIQIFDSIASILIAFLLGLMAIFLGFMNSQLLIGKRKDASSESEIKEFITSLDEVEKIYDFSTKLLGAGKVRLSLSVKLNKEDVWASSAYKQLSTKENIEAMASQDIKSQVEDVLKIAGKKVNDIEKKIQIKYPEIFIIDLEIE